ncbi:MAG: hypothetical protein NC911_06700 [Candidatus Omnitrophica bacterium]|nr:hypothetical protein [Candidatus Omnitrophota bacterium]
MQRLKINGFFLFLVFLFLPRTLFSDPEHNLARQDEARRIYEEILLEKGASPEKLASRWQWMSATYPDTEWPARLAASCVSAAFEAKRYLEVAEGVRLFCQHYPTYGRLKANLLYQLVRIVIDRQVPEDVRRRCLEVLLDHCQQASWLLSLTQNTLASLPLSSEEKYLLARKGEEVCGVYPYSRCFLWFFLDKYVSTVPPEKSLLELERFLSRYPEDSPERWAALKRWLSLKAKLGETSAGERLKEMEIAEKKVAEEVSQLAARVKDHLASGYYQEAYQEIKKIKSQPVALTEPFWRDILSLLKSLPVSQQLRFLHLALELMVPGRTAEEYYVHISTGLKWQKEVVALFKKYLEKNAGDIHRDNHKIRQLAGLPFLALGFLRSSVWMMLLQNTISRLVALVGALTGKKPSPC